MSITVYYFYYNNDKYVCQVQLSAHESIELRVTRNNRSLSLLSRRNSDPSAPGQL